MQEIECPRCFSAQVVKSGFVKGKQRYSCKKCRYNFTVNKLGKQVDPYYVVKALQLYLEGLSYREIERLLGVSHVSVMNWVKRYKLHQPLGKAHRPTYKILNHNELSVYFADRDNLKGMGMVVTELGDKFLLIKWERFKSP